MFWLQRCPPRDTAAGYTLLLHELLARGWLLSDCLVLLPPLLLVLLSMTLLLQCINYLPYSTVQHQTARDSQDGKVEQTVAPVHGSPVVYAGGSTPQKSGPQVVHMVSAALRSDDTSVEGHRLDTGLALSDSHKLQQYVGLEDREGLRQGPVFASKREMKLGRSTQSSRRSRI
ncbi:hypothetical protein F5884DRAFT_745886 [Xylogone sp. PMI_703]|nr:hypothetical protein F5884DRAFT_745886 [Xylogone sp. PMI_703]